MPFNIYGRPPHEAAERLITYRDTRAKADDAVAVLSAAGYTHLRVVGSDTAAATGKAFSGRRCVAVAELAASRPFQTADAPRRPFGDV